MQGNTPWVYGYSGEKEQFCGCELHAMRTGRRREPVWDLASFVHRLLNSCFEAVLASVSIARRRQVLPYDSTSPRSFFDLLK